MKTKLLVLLFIFACSAIAQEAKKESKQEPKLQPPQVVLIVNKDLDVLSIKQTQIEDVFLGKYTKWKTAKGKPKVTVVAQTQGDCHTAFLSKYLKKTPKQYLKYWKSKLYSGKAIMPKMLKTEQDVVDYVSKKKGSVGYISEKTLEKALSSGKKIKYLRIVKYRKDR